MNPNSSCAFCKAADTLERRYDLGNYQIARCTKCGILQQAPMPSVSELNYFYNDPNYAALVYFTSVVNSKVEVNAYRRGLAELAHFSPVPGHLLDVGCGNGQFIIKARLQGWRCHGVELSHKLSEEARCRTGTTIFEGLFEDLEFPINTYDAIVMWDLVEHLSDPHWALDRANQILKPRGVLLVYTPDYGRSLLSLIAQASYHLSTAFR